MGRKGIKGLKFWKRRDGEWAATVKTLRRRWTQASRKRLAAAARVCRCRPIASSRIEHEPQAAVRPVLRRVSSLDIICVFMIFLWHLEMIPRAVRPPVGVSIAPGRPLNPSDAPLIEYR